MKKISLVLTALALSAVIFCGCGPIEEDSSFINDSFVVTTTDEEDVIIESSSIDENSSIDESSLIEESSLVDESSSNTDSSSISEKIITPSKAGNVKKESSIEKKETETFVGPAQKVPELGEETPKMVGPAPVEETTPAEDSEEETTSQIEREYVVYKPSTHYVHRSTCHWVTSECYEISNTNDIEARKCSECNPDIEIVNEYEEPIEETAPSTYGIDSYSRQLLAEIVWHEAGSNWISQYNKAKIAAGVMNRVNDSRFPSTVYNVLTQPGQFTGYWPGCCTPTQACYGAVDYYFAHTNEFNSDNSWWGDGYQNHFYYQ